MRKKVRSAPEDLERGKDVICSNFHIPSLIKMIREVDKCRDDYDGDHRVDRRITSFQEVFCVIVLEEGQILEEAELFDYVDDDAQKIHDHHHGCSGSDGSFRVFENAGKECADGEEQQLNRCKGSHELHEIRCE